MKLIFKGGPWDGVEMQADAAPQEVRFSGFIYDGQDSSQSIPAESRSTLVLSDNLRQHYEVSGFEGPHDQIVVYEYKGG